MQCCCQNILDLCQVPAYTGIIKTGKNAAMTGEHVLELSFLDITLKIKATINITEEIVFPATELNECYVYTGKIYGPDQSLISITKDLITYDCIQFETVLVYDVTP
jgi:hypothetical protein